LDRVQVQVMSLVSGDDRTPGVNGKVMSVMALSRRTQRIGRQVRFLARLCGVEATGPPQDDGTSTNQPPVEQITDQLATQPRGLGLIKRLYAAACDTVDLPHHTLACGLFLAAAKPFLRFLEEWVWDGTLSDPCREFGVDLDPEALSHHDARFWNHGVRVDPTAAWPEFMQASIAELVNCGKSLLLLRRCAPSHFLANKKLPAPELRLSFQPGSIHLINQDVNRYASTLAGLAEGHANALDAVTHNTQQKLMDAHFKSLKRAKKVDSRRHADEQLEAAAVDDKRLAGRINADAGRTVAVEATLDAERTAATDADALAVAEAKEEKARRRAIEEVKAQTEQEYAAKEYALNLRENHARWRHKRAALAPKRTALLLELAVAWAEIREQLALGPERPLPQLPPSPTAADAEAGAIDAASNVPSPETPWADPRPRVISPPPLMNALETTADEGFADTAAEDPALPPPPTTAPFPNAPTTAATTTHHAVDKGGVSRRTLDPCGETISGLVYPTGPTSPPTKPTTEGPPLPVAPLVSSVTKPSRGSPDPRSESMSGILYPGASPRSETPVTAAALYIPATGARGETMSSLLYPDDPTTPVADRSTSVAYSSAATAALSPTDPSGETITGLLYPEPQADMVALLASGSKPDQSEAIPAGRIYGGRSTPVDQQRDSSVHTLLYPEASPEMPPALLATEEGNDQTTSTPAGRVSDTPKGGSQAESVVQSLLYPGSPAAEDRYRREGITEELTPQVPTNMKGVMYPATPTDGSGGGAKGITTNEELFLSPSTGLVPIDTPEAAGRPSDAADYRDHLINSEMKGLLYPPETPEKIPEITEDADDGNDGGVGATASAEQFIGASDPALGDSDVWGSGALKFGDDLQMVKAASAEAPSFDVNLLDTLRHRAGLSSLRPTADVHVNHQNPAADGGQVTDHFAPNGTGPGAFVTVPPSVVVERCIRIPLLYQARVVNTAVVEYFFEEVQLGEHLSAVRKFVLLASGEWAASMVGGLCAAITKAERGKMTVERIATSGLLQDALVSSRQFGDRFAERLSFAVAPDQTPGAAELGSIGSLDFVSLVFTPDWPVNILLHARALERYNTVFRLLLRVKRTSWALTDIHTRLLTRTPIEAGEAADKFRQLQSARHEMQHFVSVLAGYVSHQVLDVAWADFQAKLTAYRQNPDGLDNLIRIHDEYLDDMIFRALLNTKAAPVMKMVTSILGLVLKFREQVTQTDSIWITHTEFGQLMQTYAKFKDYAQFLYTV
jgi:hypothetical protein